MEGIASVSVLPPTRALMNTLAPRSRQGEALGLLSAAQTMGILIGPAVGAVLASQTGYTLSFVIASMPLALAAIVTIIFLPSQRKQERVSSVESASSRFSGLFTRPLVADIHSANCLNDHQWCRDVDLEPLYGGSRGVTPRNRAFLHDIRRCRSSLLLPHLGAFRTVTAGIGLS